MKVSYSEGVATHTDSKSCIFVHKGEGEALTGKKGTLLYVQLRPETAEVGNPLADHLLRPFLKGTRFYVQFHQEAPEGGKSVVAQLQDHSFDMLRVFATIELQDTLYLWLRGTKAPTLNDTACKIPALNNKEAHSVNHALLHCLVTDGCFLWPMAGFMSFRK
jgi:hypothetical protein